MQRKLIRDPGQPTRQQSLASDVAYQLPSWRSVSPCWSRCRTTRARWRRSCSPTANGITSPSIATSLPYNGDPAGIRKWLAERGVFYNEIYTNDVLANLQGGNRRGTIDQGKLESMLTVDLEKLAGLQGLSFYSNNFLIHNTGRIRRDYVGRHQHHRGDRGGADDAAVGIVVRAEILGTARRAFGSASSPPTSSSSSAISAACSCRAIGRRSPPSTCRAEGRPIRCPPPACVSRSIRPRTLRCCSAVFNGDPAGPGTGRRAIAQSLRPQFPRPGSRLSSWPRRSSGPIRARTDTGLARTLKLGGWRHLGEFDDKRFANDGTLLADPEGSGVAAQPAGKFGPLCRDRPAALSAARAATADSGISVFGRISVSPSDRNLIDFLSTAGSCLPASIPDRPRRPVRGELHLLAVLGQRARLRSRHRAHSPGSPARSATTRPISN